MKKITNISIAVIIATLIYAIPAFAATTASISPSAIRVTAGQQFNVVIAIDPQGAKNFAEKIQVDYPKDLLEVSSFNIGSGWMPLTQTGYDSIDNANGVLIKTAGYANGISSLTPFGTITFVAKTSGSASIIIDNASQSFLVSSQSAISGSSASVSVAASSIVKTVVQKKAVTSDLTPVSSVNGKIVTASASSSQLFASSSEVAAVGATTSGSGVWLWVVIILVIIIIILAYLAFKKKRE